MSVASAPISAFPPELTVMPDFCGGVEQFERAAAEHGRVADCARRHHVSLAAADDVGKNPSRIRHAPCQVETGQLPPLNNTSVPPLDTVVPVAVPPEFTTCVPPLTIVPLVKPPVSTTCEPLKIVSLLAVP